MSRSLSIQDDKDLDTFCQLEEALREEEKENGENDYYVVIVRIPSITGAVPAVYLYSKRTGTTFVSYAIENGKANNIMDANFSSSSILYWQSRIDDMLTKSGALR